MWTVRCVNHPKLLMLFTAHRNIFIDLWGFGRSEGFPNGIFHPCTLWDGGLARWKNCRQTVAAVVVVVVVVVGVGVIWKMTKYKEMHTFSKMGMSEISRNVNLAEIKAPAGAS